MKNCIKLVHNFFCIEWKYISLVPISLGKPSLYVILLYRLILVCTVSTYYMYDRDQVLSAHTNVVVKIGDDEESEKEKRRSVQEVFPPERLVAYRVSKRACLLVSLAVFLFYSPAYTYFLQVDCLSFRFLTRLSQLSHIPFQMWLSTFPKLRRAWNSETLDIFVPLSTVYHGMP